MLGPQIQIPKSTMSIQRMSKPWKPLEKQSLVCPEILTDGYGLLVIEEMLTRLPVSEMTGPLPTTNTLM